MSKQRKKPRCICKGRNDRTYPGTDHQRHCAECPMNRTKR